LGRKRTAELEVQTELAKSASVAKSRFLASMSHEIRTPMNAIIGMSELMRTDNLDEVQRGYFSDIKKMANSLLKIINDILDFSKIEAGKMELVPVHYNIFGLYNNIVSMCEYTASVKSLEFRGSFDKSIPEALFGDETRLREIITNIVNNAIKYTREGSVSLGMKKIAKDGKDFLEITVADTGIGIKKEDFPKLFGTFQQLDQEKNHGIVGTGLGLSITKNLVAMMDGEITFSSVYGEGTTFVITLPIIQGDPAKIEQKGIVDRVTAKEDVRILVVDDNSINITVALGFLATHNIFPDTATSGATAIKMVKAKAEQGCPYDLVFMDHMMPGMDGGEATKLIRAMGGEYKAMPIVALSANAVTGALEIFLEAGMNDFISKPIESQKLNAILLKWLPPEKIITEKEKAVEAAKSAEVIGDDALLEELKAIEGLDIVAGLSHVADNKTAYIQILRQFCVEFDGYIADIRQFLAAENWDEYRIRIHAMKGVFANIGVEAISKWAYKLELAAREKNAPLCKAETAPFCEAMYQFKEKLGKTSLVKPEEAREKRQVEAAALKDLIARVEEAGKHGDVDAADKLAEELADVKYSEAADPLLAELYDMLVSLDYGEAVEKVAEIVGVIGK
jgi:CheY-like chemotaxis protein/nitrogen-specific signal transduction histidine kinase/HPt (histidine-containing phosphotransfer) domain-containing protein